MKKASCFLLALLPFVAAAEILVSDGFPVGEGGYGDGQVALRSQTITDESVVGWSWQKWNNGGGSGALYSFGADSGLSFPSVMTEHGFTSVGASIGLHAEKTGNPRCGERMFNDQLRLTGKVYMRFLMSVDSTCAAIISTPAPDSKNRFTATTCYAAGLSAAWNSDANAYDYFFTTKRNVLFGVAKNGDGMNEVDLCVVDASGIRFILTLVSGDDFKADTTYLCLAEINIGAGEGGKELIRAAAIPVDAYTPDFRWATLDGDETLEAEVWDDGAYPNHLGLSGRYQNNDGYFKVDEFVLATKLSDVVYYTTALPVLESASVARVGPGFSVTAKLDKNRAKLTAFSSDGVSGVPVETLIAEDAPEREDVSGVLTGLSENTTYSVAVKAETDAGSDEKPAGIIYTGIPEIAKVGDADEVGFAHGTFTVTRADTAHDLAVNYTCGGTAVNGVNCRELSGTVIIPDGASSATIDVLPYLARPHDAATSLTITLAPGNYPLGDEPPSATMTIANLTPPADKNVWVAPADGNASVPSNWSLGRVPTETDDILVDGAFSQAQLTWDGAEESLPDTVASWTQTEAYTNKVVFNQSRTGAFTSFTVTGDATLSGGSWTHPNNGSASGAAANVWLNLRFGGNLETSVSFSFTADLKGYYKARGPGGTTSGQNGGASHGGQGGPNNATDSPYGDTVCYDNYRQPIMLGAGGFSGTSDWGGGAIHIEVEGTFSHDGLITANGGRIGTNGPGGGSVWLVAGRLAGSGTIQANGGGSNANNNKGGGGGGRVAVYVRDDVSYASFRESFTGVIAAYGGDSLNTGKFHNSGAAGTVYVETGKDQGKGRMIVAHSDELLSKASKGWTIYGTARVESGVTWDVADLVLAEHGRVGVCSGGLIKVPSFSRITGDGSTLTLLRFCDCGDGTLVSDVRHDRLIANGFGVESYGTSSMSAYHLVIPESSALKVEGTFTVGSLKLNGTKLAAGEYAASSLAETYPNVSGAGAIKVLGLSDGLMLIVR